MEKAGRVNFSAERGKTSVYSLTACLALLFLSASFSASETAIFSLPSYAVNSCRNSGFKGKALHKLYFSPNFTLPLLLFSNTVVNIILSVLSFRIVLAVFHKTEGDTATVVFNITAVTILLLVFGEFGPKLLAIRKTMKTAFALSPFVYVLGFVLYPFIKPLELFLEVVLKDRQSEILSPSEVLFLLHKARNSEMTNDSVKWKLTYSLVSLSQTEAKDIMRSRQRIPSIEKDATWAEAKSVFKKSTVKTLLVYDKNLDDVAGTLGLSKCISRGIGDGDSVKNLVEPATFVPTSAKLTAIIDDLNKTGDIYFVVKDEYGQTSGIVTEDDILGYLFGDKDQSKKIRKKEIFLKNSEFDGECTLREISEALNFYIDPALADKTVGKYILENFNDIPKKNDAIALGDKGIRVEKVKKNKIVRVSVFQEE